MSNIKIEEGSWEWALIHLARGNKVTHGHFLLHNLQHLYMEKGGKIMFKDIGNEYVSYGAAPDIDISKGWYVIEIIEDAMKFTRPEL